MYTKYAILFLPISFSLCFAKATDVTVFKLDEQVISVQKPKVDPAPVKVETVNKEVALETIQKVEPIAEAQNKSNVRYDLVEKETEALETKLKLEKEQKDLVAAQERKAKVMEELKETKQELFTLEQQYQKALAEKQENLKIIEANNQEAKQVQQKTELLKQKVAQLNMDLENTREGVKRSLLGKNESHKRYQDLINGKRSELRESLKELDQMEMAVEVEKSYAKRVRAEKQGADSLRELSSLNKSQIAKLKTSCAVKAFPNQDSKTLANVASGRSVRISRHDPAWFSSVYKGEKAFLDANCFE